MKRNLKRTIAIALTFFVAGVVIAEGSREARAADYPQKEITIIIPWGAGGGTDTLIRFLVDPISQELGVPIIVVNKPGGGGAVGLQEVATKKPDGYTICASTRSLIIQKYSLAKGLIDYKNYTPIARLASSYPVIVVPKNSPWDKLEDLIKAAKKSPGSVTFGTSGTGSTTHLWTIKFASETGIEVSYVPYDGGRAQVTAVMGGHVNAALTDSPPAHQLMSAGNIKMLVHGVDKPHPFYPNVPTFKDYGIDLWAHWYGMWGPKGLPQEKVDKIYNALASAVKNEKFQKGVKKMAYVESLLGPREFAELWEKDDRVTKEIFDKMK